MLKKLLSIILIIISLFTLNIKTYALEINSNNMVFYNVNEEIIVDEKNKDERISIASLTKLMTTIVALEHIDNLDERVTLTANMFYGLIEADASVAGFKEGDIVTYRDLLYGIMLPSGADATNAISIKISGSELEFVKLMNNKAEYLNMTNTNYMNASGLDNNKAYSTVNDVLKLLIYALKNNTFKEMYTSSSYITTNNLVLKSNLSKSTTSANIDVNYIKGSKTGYTEAAGLCLSSMAYDKTNDITYLLVTAKAPTSTPYSHILDAKKVYEYYFKSFGYNNVTNEDMIVKVNTRYSKQDYIEISINKENILYVENNYNKSRLTTKYEGINTIYPNNNIGDKLGTLKIYFDNKQIDEVDIILDKNIEFSTISFIKSNIIIVILVIILFIILTILLLIKKKNKCIIKNYM